MSYYIRINLISACELDNTLLLMMIPDYRFQVVTFDYVFPLSVCCRTSTRKGYLDPLWMFSFLSIFHSIILVSFSDCPLIAWINYFIELKNDPTSWHLSPKQLYFINKNHMIILKYSSYNKMSGRVNSFLNNQLAKWRLPAILVSVIDKCFLMLFLLSYSKYVKH